MQKGDIVQLEFDAWIAGTDELFDTTSEESAKKHDVYDEKEKRKYKPINVIVGAGKVIPGLDNSLLSAEVGKEVEIEVAPKDAYGERDPKIVEVRSIHEFVKQQISPYIGLRVTLRNKTGTVVGVSAGRVVVDFNNPLAGKKLKYKYKITKKFEDLTEKILAIVESHYSKEGEFKAHHGENFTSIIVPNICKYDNEWFMVKYLIIKDLQEYTGTEKVHMIEEYVKATEKPKVEEKKEGENKEEAKGEDKAAPKEEKAEEEASPEEVPKEERAEQKSGSKGTKRGGSKKAE